MAYHMYESSALYSDDDIEFGCNITNEYVIGAYKGRIKVFM